MDSREQLFYLCYQFSKNTQQMRFTVQEVILYYKKNKSIQTVCPSIFSQITNLNIYQLIDELYHVDYITKTKYIGVKPLYISFNKEQYKYAKGYFVYLQKLGVL